MKDTLVDLWNGRLAPLEQFENDKEMEELLRLIERNREKLEAVLDQKQKDQMDRYIACIHEHDALFATQAFCAGFRLGSRLFAEAWLCHEPE